MPTMFLDPKEPIATCDSGDCGTCTIGEEVHCHFDGSDLTVFFFAIAPWALTGAAGIWMFGVWWFAPWAALIVGHFGFAEIRVLCVHCAHYAKQGKSLRCWTSFGSPRLWKYRPGPMSAMEKAVFLGGLALVMAYPLVFLALGGRWLLLTFGALALIGFFVTLGHRFCSRCMNFSCPLNRVDEEVRSAFFELNPKVADAWKDGESRTAG